MHAIFTNSRSCLQARQQLIQTNLKVHELKHTIPDLIKSGKTIELCWIPGQAGIPGNETAGEKSRKSIKTAGRNYNAPLSRHSSQTQYQASQNNMWKRA